MPGVKLELRSGRRVIVRATSDAEGRYSFGKVQPGKYNIRILGGIWCAPKVHYGTQVCTIESTIEVKPIPITVT